MDQQAPAIKSGQAPLINYMELTTSTPTTTKTTPPQEPKEPEGPTEPIPPQLPNKLMNIRTPRVTCVVCGQPGTKFYKHDKSGSRVLYFEHTDQNSYRAPSGRLMGKICRVGILQDASGLDELMKGAEPTTTPTPTIKPVTEKATLLTKKGKYGPLGYCQGCKKDNVELRYHSRVIKKARICVTCYGKELKDVKEQKKRKAQNDKPAIKKPAPVQVKRPVGRPRIDYKRKYLNLKKRWDHIAKSMQKPTS